MYKEISALSLVIVLAASLTVFPQQRSQAAQVAEPKSVVLLFREDFKSGLPNQLPLLPEHVTNSNLEPQAIRTRRESRKRWPVWSVAQRRRRSCESWAEGRLHLDGSRPRQLGRYAEREE